MPVQAVGIVEHDGVVLEVLTVLYFLRGVLEILDEFHVVLVVLDRL